MEEFMKFDLLSWFSPSRSPTFEGKINSNSSLASNFQEFFPYQSRGKWKFIYPWANLKGALVTGVRRI